MFSKRRTKILIISGIALSLLITFLAHFPAVLHLPQENDPTARLVGWKELGQEVTMICREMAKSAPVFIFSDRYQVSSELAFYMDNHPATYCINLGRRMNQYDLWPGFENFIGHHAIFVRKGIQDLPETVKNAFDNCVQNIVTPETRQKKTMKFTIFKCYDFKGMKMKQTESF